jgi:hypothetical protein
LRGGAREELDGLLRHKIQRCLQGVALCGESAHETSESLEKEDDEEDPSEGEEEQRVIEQLNPNDQDQCHGHRLQRMDHQALEEWRERGEVLDGLGGGEEKRDPQSMERRHWRLVRRRLLFARALWVSRAEGVVPFHANGSREVRSEGEVRSESREGRDETRHGPEGGDDGTLEEVRIEEGEVCGHKEIRGRVEDDLCGGSRVNVLADLSDDGRDKLDDSGDLSPGSVGDKELDDDTLRGLVDDNLDEELETAGDDIGPLPFVASLKTTQQREVDEEKVQQDHHHPSHIFGGLRNDQSAAKATRREGGQASRQGSQRERERERERETETETERQRQRQTER